MKNKFIILLFCLLLLTGCGNYRELNQIAIITGIGIDKKDDKYQVNVLIANAGKTETSNKEGESQPTVYSGKGKTLAEAIKIVDTKTPKQLYFGHVNVVLISEEIAKDGFLKVADYLLRKPESRKKFYLIMTKDCETKDVLEIVSPLESFPSQNIASLMKANTSTQSITNITTYSDFINQILTKGFEPILPSITIVGDKDIGDEKKNINSTTPKAYIKLEKTALFKNDKFIGYATNDDAQAINILKNTSNQSVFTIKYKDDYINITTRNIKSKTKLKNKKVIKISVKGDARITEINNFVNLNDKATINKLQTRLNNKIEKELSNIIIKMQTEHQSDIFGFGNLVYKNYPHYFNKIEKKWNDKYFPKMDVLITSNVNLVSTGSLENTIRKEANR